MLKNRQVLLGFAAIAESAAATADSLRALQPAIARAAETLHRTFVSQSYERVWLEHASRSDRLRYDAMRLGGVSQLHAILIIEAER